MNRIAASGALFVGAVAIGCVVREDLSAARPPRQTQDPTVIDGYRGWTKVNTKPHRVHAAPMSLCISPPPSHQRVLDTPESGNHEFYVAVYVNARGRSAMFAKATPDFPTGSVIVKEKLPKAEDSQPQLLTVMVKKSSAPQDWEYLAFDAGGHSIADAAKSGNCRGCHEARKDSGYVFRSYLPR